MVVQYLLCQLAQETCIIILQDRLLFFFNFFSDRSCFYKFYCESLRYFLEHKSLFGCTSSPFPLNFNHLSRLFIDKTRGSFIIKAWTRREFFVQRLLFDSGQIIHVEVSVIESNIFHFLDSHQ